MTTIGVLHPGEMGAAVAAGFRAGGADVVWVGGGRSAATRARAVTAGLRDMGSLDALVTEADVVVSVCPPDAALGLAGSVAAGGFAGVYVDANAVSPATARAVHECVSAAGATYVDGGIVGGPDAPRLFLAGAAAAEVAANCAAPVEPVVLDGGGYPASALKMVYAGWTKATSALLLSLVGAARQLGVEEVLRAEWDRSQPALGRRLDAAVASTRKAWRWEGEMVEIARTLADAGLPDGFHRAAAEVFARLVALKDDDDAALDDVLTLLAAHALPQTSGDPTRRPPDDGVPEDAPLAPRPVEDRR